MSLVLVAFPPADVAAMEEDPSLNGSVLRSSRGMADALSNGCDIVDPGLVQQQASALSAWTHAEIRAGLPALEGDAYRMEVYQDDEEVIQPAG
jgi:hypothetical protein